MRSVPLPETNSIHTRPLGKDMDIICIINKQLQLTQTWPLPTQMGTRVVTYLPPLASNQCSPPPGTQGMRTPQVSLVPNLLEMDQQSLARRVTCIRLAERKVPAKLCLASGTNLRVEFFSKLIKQFNSGKSFQNNFRNAKNQRLYPLELHFLDEFESFCSH